MTKILVVEDNPEVSGLIELHLQDAGYEVETAMDGRIGLERALSRLYNLIVLDLMLPHIDGMEICRQVRRQSGPTPILMLTARSSEDDRVAGLESGSDDYVTKPFGIRELLARVRAILRRSETSPSAPPVEHIRAGELDIDLGRRQVKRAGRSIDLTAKEFDLLSTFARNPGKVLARRDLLEMVWGYGHAGYEHTVNTHINRLRTKIEDNPSSPRFILTVWGVGYKFFEPDEHA